MTENFYTENIGAEPEIDFEKSVLCLKNGTPNTIDQLEAVRQWVTKFCMSEQDAYPIYLGTGFGTRFKQLYGQKRIGYGYEEAEIERDFREGLLLCPAIADVIDVEIKKSGKILGINIQIRLYNGDLANINIEKAYTIKG